MAGCDFTNYNMLRDDTRNKAAEAATACAQVETAQAGVIDAQATLDAANAAKAASYSAWEIAEQAENAEARRLGIDPTPSPLP